MLARNYTPPRILIILVGILVMLTSCKKDPASPPVTGSPSKLTAVNGRYYKGLMKSAIQTPLLQLKTADSSGNPVGNAWIHFRLLEGDGTLSVTPGDSAKTDPAGNATITYNFSGLLGHASLRALLTAKDSADLVLRANTIIMGSHSQAQYIRTGDTYATVKNFNGPPLAVDVDPNYYLTYVVYESTLGLVLIVEDKNKNNAAEDTESVVGLIVNSSGANGEYKGKTAEGIGLGSKYSDIRTAYGPADSLWVDPTPPAAIVLSYLSGALYIYCTTADTTAFEMHLVPPIAPPALSRPTQLQETIPLVSSTAYHRFRR